MSRAWDGSPNPDEDSLEEIFGDLNAESFIEWVEEHEEDGIKWKSNLWNHMLNTYIEAMMSGSRYDHYDAREYLLMELEREVPLVYQALNYGTVGCIAALSDICRLHLVMVAEGYRYQGVK